MVEYLYELNEEERTRHRALLTQLRLNMARCHLKQRDPIAAKELCDKVAKRRRAVTVRYDVFFLFLAGWR